MAASDARALAHRLNELDDDRLAALLQARHVSPGVAWGDAFDAAEYLLDAASVARAVTVLTSGEAEALAAGGPAPEPIRAVLDARGLLDENGLPWAAVRDAVESARSAAGTAAPLPAGSAREGAAEHAFAAVASLADVLQAALSTPLGRIGAGRLAATDRRRLVEAGAADDAAAADEIVAIADQAGLVAAENRAWLVTSAGMTWLGSSTLVRWGNVAAALIAMLPRGVRAPDGGWIPVAQWPGAYPFDPDWPGRAARLLHLLQRWAVLDAAGEAPPWSAPAERGANLDLDALAGVLPHEVDRVYLQNDLTAIAPGSLAPHLDMRLRSMARRESRAQASTYRFTAETLADALTAGETAETLRAFLLELSLTGLPQPLAYEIERTAGRHGALRVGPDWQARTRVSSDDEALLRTLSVDQALRPLGLVFDGDTLVSRSGPDTAFWMIADARYPVVAVDADGNRRALDRHRLAEAPEPAPSARDEYAAVIDRLRAAQSGDADAAWLGRELEQAVRARATITVAVRLPDGSEREFTIEATGLGGGRLRGRDRHVDVERTLPTSHITRVSLP